MGLNFMSAIMRSIEVRVIGGLFGRQGTVRTKLSSTEIRKDLAGFGMCPSFFTTVFKIKGMKIDQYEGFKVFLGAVQAAIKKTQPVDFRITVVMPRVKMLKRLNFAKFLSNDDAMKSVLETCPFKTAPTVLDLGKIHKIYNAFFPPDYSSQN